MNQLLLNRAAKLFAASMVIVATLSTSVQAASFIAQRGINMDIWTTWPGRDKWADPGVMLPFPEWRRHVSARGLKQLKQDGFDFIRMPVDPAPFLADESAALRGRLIDSVAQSVDAITDAGLKVIVDLHLYGDDRTGHMASVMANSAEFDRYVDMVRAIAAKLADKDPKNVALELMNEPAIDCEPGENGWPRKQNQLFAAARSSATKLTLVLTGACWSGADHLAAVDPASIVDDNVIWTFHSYAPFLLTHQGASWAGDFIGYVNGLPYPPASVPRLELDLAVEKVRERIRNEASLFRRPGHLAYLDKLVAEIDTDEKLKAVMDKPFDTVSAWAAKHNIAPANILLGEFGMITQDYGKPEIVPPAWRVAYTRDVIARAEAHGFAWSIWGYGGSYGLVDSFDGRKADPAPLDVIRKLPPRLRTTVTD